VSLAAVEYEMLCDAVDKLLKTEPWASLDPGQLFEMADRIKERANARADAAYFGGCPRCGSTDGYVNAGCGHWFVCNAHRVKWFVGSNLFSSVHDQTEADQRAVWAPVEDFATVEPVRRACPA
jgi:hypothetical protein